MLPQVFHRHYIEVMVPKSTEAISVEVLGSTNENSRYSSCSRYFLQFWNKASSRSQVTFHPHILTFGMPHLETEIFTEIAIDEDIPTGFAAQISRLIIPSYSDKHLVMTTDIDMVPLSFSFFDKCAKLAHAQNAIVLFGKRDCEFEVPICYVISSPENWRRLTEQFFQPSNSLSEIARIILERFGGMSSYVGVRGEQGWNIDQLFLHEMIAKRPESLKVIEIECRHPDFRRLDRIHHNGHKRWLALILVLLGRFDDYHLHLPVEHNYVYLRVTNFVLYLRKFLHLWF